MHIPKLEKAIRNKYKDSMMSYDLFLVWANEFLVREKYTWAEMDKISYNNVFTKWQHEYYRKWVDDMKQRGHIGNEETWKKNDEKKRLEHEEYLKHEKEQHEKQPHLKDKSGYTRHIKIMDQHVTEEDHWDL